MTHRSTLPALATALTLLFGLAPAQAQFAVFISGNGNDANNCRTPATACRSYGQAQTIVQPGGIIHVLPGDYSSFEITKSVQIIADAGQASVSGSTFGVGGISAGLFVNAGPSDVVLIRGMIIDRHGSTSGGGIALIAGDALHVENCTLVNAAGDFGIRFRPSGHSKLVVSNSTIANSGSGGIEVRPEAGATASVTIDNSRLSNNGLGVLVRNRGNVTIRNSMIASNATGILSRGGSATVHLADSTVSGSTLGLSSPNNGQIISHRGNVLTDNGADGTFTSTVNQQ